MINWDKFSFKLRDQTGRLSLQASVNVSIITPLLATSSGPAGKKGGTNTVTSSPLTVETTFSPIQVSNYFELVDN